MLIRDQGALIVQSDLSVLLDEHRPNAEQAREKLYLIADAVSRAGSIHTYRITALSLWNAVNAGISADDVIDWLSRYSRYELPVQAEATIRTWIGRYGKLRLIDRSGRLLLVGDGRIMNELFELNFLREWVVSCISEDEWEMKAECRGLLKQELTRLGYPVVDMAGYHAGESLSVKLRDVTVQGRPFELRDYQLQAAEPIMREGALQGGSGVVVMPCGTGKTIVGITALARLNTAALILTSSTTSVQQWKSELLDKTTLADDDIGQYCGKLRQVRPITIATYNLLTHRKSRESPFTHMKLFSERDWGLIIYDEVHLLPAPVFRMTASIQATRRLGLTATLVREDGCAEDVYSLIGPKQFDMQWKSAEAASYIATVTCTEIRVPLHQDEAKAYVEAAPRSRLRIAAENPIKITVLQQLLHEHAGKPTLIIGQYLNQLHVIADVLGAPILTGEVPHSARQMLYEKFKSGKINVLIVSKIANLAVDLPDAAVAIQLSGSFGSRQEEAQRIGRLLRPKKGRNEAWFYSIVTDSTKETEFAMKRQLFMLEQGYQYKRLSLASPSHPTLKEAIER